MSENTVTEAEVTETETTEAEPTSAPLSAILGIAPTVGLSDVSTAWGRTQADKARFAITAALAVANGTATGRSIADETGTSTGQITVFITYGAWLVRCGESMAEDSADNLTVALAAQYVANARKNVKGRAAAFGLSDLKGLPMGAEMRAAILEAAARVKAEKAAGLSLGRAADAETEDEVDEPSPAEAAPRPDGTEPIVAETSNLRRLVRAGIDLTAVTVVEGRKFSPEEAEAWRTAFAAAREIGFAYGLLKRPEPEPATAEVVAQ
jgi:hypothetical protein